MKQMVQDYRTGRLTVDDVPRPAPLPGQVLVRSVCSLISAGTERMGIELARKSLLGKARQRPDLARKVLQKAKTDGLIATVRAALARLDEWAPLGYSCAGEVLALGPDAGHLQVGNPVACAGAGYASHAEAVCVPKHLVARIPPGVSHEEAAFVTLGAIALQGVRQAGVVVGERVAVIGLGLIGQLTCQLVTAAGAFAFGIDVDPHKVELARSLGAANGIVRHAPGLARWAEKLTGGAGFDAVLITAATKGSDPVVLAGEIARDRATVVAVGAVGMDVPRPTYYQKELTFKLSRSYGPGRYDPSYEEKGIDYPIGYVRWTENHNMEAFLALLAAGKLDVRSLITHRFGIDQALEAYKLVTGERPEPHLGILLTYREGSPIGDRRLPVAAQQDRGAGSSEPQTANPRVGVIGAGRFARAILLPALKSVGGCIPQGVCSAEAIPAKQAAKQFGFAYCTCQADEILADGETDAVFIATPHNLHARMVCDALAAGKHVLVEKPLCLNGDELAAIEQARAAHPDRLLMVGFNRRFSPFTTWLKERLAHTGPLVMNCRVLAGPPPRDHWSTDPAIGGGRMIGEVCHFVDWMVSVCGFLPVAVAARPIPDGTDSAVVTIRFQNGSVGTVTYLASAPPGLPKEHIEVLAAGRAAEIHNWRAARLWGEGRGRKLKTWSQKKGHREEIQAFLEAIRQRAGSPVPFAEIAAVTRATFAIEESRRTGAQAVLSPGAQPEPAC